MTDKKFNNNLFNLYPSSIIPFINSTENPFKDKIESFHIKFDENDNKMDSVFKEKISRYNFKYNMEYSTEKNVVTTAAFVGTYVPPPINGNEQPIFTNFRPIYIVLDMDESTISKIKTIFSSNKPRKLQTDEGCDNITNTELEAKQEKKCDFIRCKLVHDNGKEVQANYYFYICFNNNMIDITNSYLVNKVVSSKSMFSKKRCRNIIGKVTMGLIKSDAPASAHETYIPVSSPRKPLPQLPQIPPVAQNEFGSNIESRMTHTETGLSTANNDVSLTNTSTSNDDFEDALKLDIISGPGYALQCGHNIIKYIQKEAMKISEDTINANIMTIYNHFKDDLQISPKTIYQCIKDNYKITSPFYENLLSSKQKNTSIKEQNTSTPSGNSVPNPPSNSVPPPPPTPPSNSVPPPPPPPAPKLSNSVIPSSNPSSSHQQGQYVIQQISTRNNNVLYADLENESKATKQINDPLFNAVLKECDNAQLVDKQTLLYVSIKRMVENAMKSINDELNKNNAVIIYKKIYDTDNTLRYNLITIRSIINDILLKEKEAKAKAKAKAEAEKAKAEVEAKAKAEVEAKAKAEAEAKAKAEAEMPAAERAAEREAKAAAEKAAAEKAAKAMEAVKAPWDTDIPTSLQIRLFSGRASRNESGDDDDDKANYPKIGKIYNKYCINIDNPHCSNLLEIYNKLNKSKKNKLSSDGRLEEDENVNTDNDKEDPEEDDGWGGGSFMRKSKTARNRRNKMKQLSRRKTGGSVRNNYRRNNAKSTINKNKRRI